jgi:hypothetical protein
MSVNPGDVNQLRRVIAQTVREHSTLFLVEGIILVVLGILAILIPMAASIAITIILGCFSRQRGRGPGHLSGRVTHRASGGRRLRRSPPPPASSRAVAVMASSADAAAHRFRDRGRCLDHVCVRAQEGPVDLMLVSGLIDLILAALI